MKKRMLVMSAAVLIGGGATVLGTMGVTNAAAGNTSETKAGLIHRVSRRRAHDRLSQAVTDGTLTAVQKSAFQEKVKKLREERKSAVTSSSTAAQKQAERTTLKSELQSWATTTNFPLAKIFPKLAA
jgi:hypothetical protein